MGEYTVCEGFCLNIMNEGSPDLLSFAQLNHISDGNSAALVLWFACMFDCGSWLVCDSNLI